MLSLRRTLASPALRRPFSTTTRLAHKESSSQTNEDYESHKQDSLAKQRRGKAEWKRELASDSEEAVKAERDHDGETPESLMHKTKDEANRKG